MAFWSQAHHASLPNPPSLIQFKSAKNELWRFLIMDAPTDSNLHVYVQELRKHDIDVVVRTCEATYSAQQLKKDEIDCVELTFADGSPPSPEIIGKWLKLVEKENRVKKKAISVHCVAGLGRSPVLVAIALMELANASALDAVAKIRAARRGAINQKQNQWLQAYVCTRKESCCIVM